MERGNTFTDTTCLSLIFVSFLQPGQVYNVKFYWQSVFVCSLENTTPSFLHCWRSHIYISLMLVSTFFGWLFIVSLSALRNLGLLSVGLSHVGRQSWQDNTQAICFFCQGYIRFTGTIFLDSAFTAKSAMFCHQAGLSGVVLMSGSCDLQTPEKICQAF